MGQVGGATRLTDEDEATLRASAGVHLASVTSAPFDIGAGWTMDRADGETSHGAYLDGAYFVDETDVSRLALGTRAELRFGDERVFEAKLRAEYEGYTREVGRYGRGAFAVGPYFEVGRAWATESPNAWIASVGVVFRVPAFFTP